MINFLWKNRTKKEWNILILVILVMLAASMLWLLTMSFLKNMFVYTSDLEWYYKSYYMSKAWLELALVEINNSNVGLSTTVPNWSTIVRDNFVCDDCDVSMKVQWKSSFLSEKFWLGTWCTDDTAFKLNWWESLLIPLFVQNSVNSISDILVWDVWKESLADGAERLKVVLLDNDVRTVSPVLNLWLFFVSWYDFLDEYIYIKSGVLSENMITDYLWEFNGLYPGMLNSDSEWYLMISNSKSGSLASFCLQSIKELNTSKVLGFPTTKYYVISLWKYKTKYVWLQAIYAQPVPNFMLNTYLNWFVE